MVRSLRRFRWALRNPRLADRDLPSCQQIESASALRAADQGNYQLLLAFVRS
jgi:hypothetical protein